MAQESDMNRDTLKQYIEEQQQERIESYKQQAQVGAKVRETNQPVMRDRANDKQIGGDHYKSMGVEPWHVIDTWPLEQRIGAYRAGALKYLMRCGGKDDRIQEIKKAGHYIDKLIEVLNEESNNTKGT
jgi:hypothetical protein